MATHREVTSNPLDGIIRFFHGAKVTNENIDQCPKCRGTDSTTEKHEGFGITLFKCSRCRIEWWA